MTSNYSAGERRWASARRTGMTVLGKVAVPKPLNLPSQRLENRRQDPNVEIVPKGVLGWGGRSPSTSNAWGSTTQSPNADGSVSSPSQPSGRPSSAETGSRPSTPGSERAPERPANAWGPSSRPSSASDVLPSHQSSTTLRPHSADTRPSSSQLSRFAETSLESSVIRAPSSAVEKVQGLISSENERFSLSSGDFPTLGSSKDSSAKTSEPKDHDSCSRPNSASGKNGRPETSQDDAHIGAFSSWTRDGPQNSDELTQPGLSKWHGEPHQYHEANIPPPQFDAWRGPPMNAPPGVWYRGPHTAPPYGPPVGPRGFPIEPYPYYCPQIPPPGLEIPPPGLANSQPVPMPGAGPRGHNHPKNGELYRPQVPDAFVHPGMPFRPGFYRGPVPYDGFYGPPMGYGSSHDRDVPHKGVAGPSVYNRYANPSAPSSGHSQARAGRNGPTGRNFPDHEVTVQHGDTSVQNKVLLKHNEWEGKEDKRITERMAISNSSHSKKDGRSSTVSTRREWGADVEGEEELDSSVSAEGGHDSFHLVNDQVSCGPEAVKFKPNVVDSGPINQQITAASSTRMVQASVAMQRNVSVTANARDSTLMQKIEGLNVKVRGCEGRNEGLLTLESDELQHGSQLVETKLEDALTKVGNYAVSHEKKPALKNMGEDLPSDRTSASGNRSSQPAFASRRSSDVVAGKSGDNHVRHKKPVPTEISGMLAANTPSSHVHVIKMQADVTDVELISGNIGEDAASEIHESADSQGQRAKMKEMAKQRALQLQMEEDGRIKEQKAKALAKLEELNRRTQGSNSSKSETVLSPAEQEVQEQEVCSELSTIFVKSEAAKPASAPLFDDVTQLCVGTVPLGDKCAAFVTSFPSDRLKAVALDPVVLGGQSLAAAEEAHNVDASHFRISPKTNEGSVSRQKRNSFKPKDNVQQQKNMTEQLQLLSTSNAQKDKSDLTSCEVRSVATDDVLRNKESKLQRNTTLVEYPSQQKKRNYKSSRKLKLEEAIPISVPPLVAVNESCSVEVCAEIENFNDDKSDQGFGLSQRVGTGINGSESAKQESSTRVEDGHGRVNNHKKPQPSHRFARNQQSSRPVDKFHSNDNVMWAPVRSQNNSEVVKEISQQTLQESVSLSKNDQLRTNSKSKRVEMERYVPKPVAKELAQQGNILQPFTSGGSTKGLETGLRSSEGLQAGSSASYHVSTEDRETNKQMRRHGAWHQRGLAEAPSSGSSSYTSKTAKNHQRSVGQNHSMMPEVVSEKEEGTLSSNLEAYSDHNVSTNDEVALPIGMSSVRNQATGKVKRHAFKAEKNLGSNNGQEKHFNTGEVDRTPEFSDSDVRQPKENSSFEERGSSHWQPKSHPSLNDSQRGSRSISVPNDSGGMSGVKKNFSSHTRSHDILRIKEVSEKEVSHRDQSLSENKIPEFVNVGRQSHRKERKVSTSVGPPNTPNEAAVGFEESTNIMTADGMNKQQSSDIRSRYQNNYLGPTREFRGDWGHERHRPNRHYEYHPVGSQNNRKPERVEDGSQNVGPRYKDRGQILSKHGRGNFHGRQSSGV